MKKRLVDGKFRVAFPHCMCEKVYLGTKNTYSLKCAVIKRALGSVNYRMFVESIYGSNNKCTQLYNMEIVEKNMYW